MAFVQIYLARNEMEASIVSGNLESAGIKAKYMPINNNSPLNGTWLQVQDIPYGVWVEEGKIEEAKKVLAERE